MRCTAAGKIAARSSLCDYMTLSAHKLGGPQGAGALVVKRRRSLCRRKCWAAASESGLRAGTENLSGIAGFGAAAEAAADAMTRPYRGIARPFRRRAERDRARRHRLRRTARRALPTHPILRCPASLAETAVIALDLDGVMVSSGAACSSGKVTPSHVLAAMGVCRRHSRAAHCASASAGIPPKKTSMRRSHRFPNCSPAPVRARPREAHHGRRRKTPTKKSPLSARSTNTASSPTSRWSARPRASAKTRCATSRPRRASRNGCWNGGWAPSAAGRDERAQMGAGALSQDRLPERLLLRRAQEHARRSKVAGRSRSQAAGDLQQAGHSAA